jgi:hypothetical protein
MILIIKTEQGNIERFPTKDKIILTESFTSFLLSENSLDLDFQERKIPLIGHIDLYADTYVNSTQAEMYIKEFEKLLEYTRNELLKEFCKIAINELKNLDIGYFLVFSGD